MQQKSNSSQTFMTKTQGILVSKYFSYKLIVPHKSKLISKSKTKFRHYFVWSFRNNFFVEIALNLKQ